MAHFASANLPCALAMCCFIIARCQCQSGSTRASTLAHLQAPLFVPSCNVPSRVPICHGPLLCQGPLLCHGPLPPAILSWAFAWQVGGGKMVWHVGMGKWAGQVGMRTQTRAHGAAPAPRRDACAPGQDVSSAPAGAIYADMLFAEQFMRGCTLPSAHLPTGPCAPAQLRKTHLPKMAKDDQ